jgi:hypothetical protein
LSVGLRLGVRVSGVFFTWCYWSSVRGGKCDILFPFPVWFDLGAVLFFSLSRLSRLCLSVNVVYIGARVLDGVMAVYKLDVGSIGI